MAFDNGVSSPGGSSYSAPLLSFLQFSNWAADDPYQQTFKKQQQQLNDQAIRQGQTRQDIQQTFQGGLPRNADGSIDYARAVAMLAQKGDTSALWNGADAMYAQSASRLSPLLSGGGQPTGAPVAPAAGGDAPPQPAPGRTPVQQGVQGDSGGGTIASLVTDRLPNQDTATGQTIAKIAGVMGVDPNANLTAGQLRRVQGLIQKYAPGDSGGSPAAAVAAGGSGAAASATPSQRVASAFGALPPSANAGTPAASPAQGQGQGQGAPQPAAPQAAPQPQPAPQQVAQAQPQGQPIVPQVPLPKGFTDPQAAILALRGEAARLAANPRAQGQVQELNNWASRIEESIKPVKMGPNDTLLDPKSGQPIYQGAAQSNLSPQALNDAAERYLQTGLFPPGTGRGIQGDRVKNEIQNIASDLAVQRGIDPNMLPQRWQQFKGQQVAIQRFTSGPQGNTIRSFNVLVDHLDTLSDAAAALKNGDIRRFNSWKQTWAAERGETAPTNFDGVKALVGDEIVKAVVGSAGALADREEVKKDLDRASSPKQLAELVERYKKLALGQLHGLQKQYETSTGQKNFGDMLLPGTLKALGGNDGKSASGQSDKDGWVTLPNGARIQEVK